MILTPDQVVMALLQAQRELGVQLTRDELIGLTEIPSRESGYDSGAFHDSEARGDGTGDLSYGLWQINMLGGMGTSRARALGLPPTRAGYEALKDPVTNAKAAIQLVLAGRQQGDPLHAWGGYKGMSNTYNVSSQAASAASAAVDRIGAGVSGGGESFLANMRQNIYGSSTKGQSPAAGSLVAWLNQQIGKPYVFGASDPNGNAFDCSGLVSAAYKQLGIDVPALTFTMKNYGVQVSTDQLQPGDLMFRHGSQGDFGHVGVYVGGGQVIEAPHTGAFVRAVPVDDWIAAANAQGGTVRRLIDGQGRVIVGGGLTPGMRPGLSTVPVSQAEAIPDALSPNTGGDPFAVPGATQPKIIEDRQPLLLPGFGKELTNV